MISGEALRALMRKVPTPVVVVTARTPHEIRGMTAGSFTSVSLEPPLVSFNVQVTSRMHAALETATEFAIHILSAEQGFLSDHFAQPDQTGVQQFRDVPHRLTDAGLPILTGTLGVFHCTKWAAYPAGDHTLFLGEVQHIEVGEDGPALLYYDRAYHGLLDGSAP